MATPPELHEFIKTGLMQRIPHEQITAVLRENGWTTRQIEEAFLSFAQPAVAEVATVLNPAAVPVYTPAPYGQTGVPGSLSGQQPSAVPGASVLPPSQLNPKKKQSFLPILLTLVGLCVLIPVLGVAIVYVGDRVAPNNAFISSSHQLLVKLTSF